MACIRYVVNPWLWVRLKLGGGRDRGEDGDRKCDEVDANMRGMTMM